MNMKCFLILFVAFLSTIDVWADDEMLSTPLTLEAISTGKIMFQNQAKGIVTYKVNDGKVQSIKSKTIDTIDVNTGDIVTFWGDNDKYPMPSNLSLPSTISCTAPCYIYGNIMSLVSSINFTDAKTLGSEETFIHFFFRNNCITNHPNKKLKLPATTLSKGCYTSMFYNCTNLTEAPELPAKTLSESCYYCMFEGCSSLIKAPELPATTMVKKCYVGMFSGCTSLSETPKLPAETLADSCYSSMFSGCSSIIEAPALPATSLAKYCYSRMFSKCINLTKAPELPATILAPDCYSAMFNRCSSLKNAPALPATTLADYCYYDMFSSCTSLTSAPMLPATSLEKYCYSSMFYNCTSLVEAPVLPATTLAECCYEAMFQKCSSLVKTPELPATTLVSRCYSKMFQACNSLTISPILPATKLVDYCYGKMFSGCSNLREVTCLAIDISATGCVSDWLLAVSANGTFNKNPAMNDWRDGSSGIPQGWKVVDYDPTNINFLKTGEKIGKSYDLRGILTGAKTKGLNIINKKKVIRR